jgi:hypothetical protein
MPPRANLVAQLNFQRATALSWHREATKLRTIALPPQVVLLDGA